MFVSIHTILIYPFFSSRFSIDHQKSSKKDTEDSNNPLKVILVDDGSSTESSATKTTTVRTTKQYGCNQCSYSADKKVSLNRHMRMHQTSPTNSSVTSNGDDCSSQVKTIFLLTILFCMMLFVRFTFISHEF